MIYKINKLKNKLKSKRSKELSQSIQRKSKKIKKKIKPKLVIKENSMKSKIGHNVKIAKYGEKQKDN